jgi:transposase
VIGVPPRILFARRPVDFRKQIDGLAAVCERELGEEPLDGTLFLFTNRDGNALKALVWTHGGFTLVYKKLERGRFSWPSGDEDRVRMTPGELAALLEGIDVRNAPRLRRWNPEKAHGDALEHG